MYIYDAVLFHSPPERGSGACGAFACKTHTCRKPGTCCGVLSLLIMLTVFSSTFCPAPNYDPFKYRAVARRTDPILSNDPPSDPTSEEEYNEEMYFDVPRADRREAEAMGAD